MLRTSLLMMGPEQAWNDFGPWVSAAREEGQPIGLPQPLDASSTIDVI